MYALFLFDEYLGKVIKTNVRNFFNTDADICFERVKMFMPFVIKEAILLAGVLL